MPRANLMSRDTNKLLTNTSDDANKTFERSTETTQNALLPYHTRYKSLEDLQSRLGVAQLDSYIVPELKEISEHIKRKKIQV